MLFQGQEFAASSPFLYFARPQPGARAARAEGTGRVRVAVRERRIGAADERVPDPSDVETFRRCKLDWTERASNREALALHRDLIRLRREDATLSRRTPGRSMARFSATARSCFASLASAATTGSSS